MMMVMMVRVKCHILSKLIAKKVNEMWIVGNHFGRSCTANMTVHATIKIAQFSQLRVLFSS